MNEEEKKEDVEKVLEAENKWSGDGFWVIMLFLLLFGGNNNENPRISELEKKVARLEGQMSMIGGKTL